MIHYGGSDKMYLSEEMIGAYLEGNLAPHDARYVESLIERDSNLSSLVDECKTFNDFSHQYGYHSAISFTGAEDSFPDLDDSFSLPDIPNESIVCQLGITSDSERNILLGDDVSVDIPFVDIEDSFLSD